MKKAWWPIHIKYYRHAFFGWKRLSYCWYAYEDGMRYEHQLVVGKFWIYFGYPERGIGS